MTDTLRFLHEASDDGAGDRGTLFTNVTMTGSITETAPSETTLESPTEQFDPLVFWCVNAFLIFMLISVCCCLCVMKPEFLTNMHERRQRADSQYQQTLRERIQREEAKKVETPEKRKQRLLQSFKRHNVQMIVKESDLLQEDEAVDLEQQDNDVEIGNDDDLSQTSGLLKLASNVRTEPVPCCCAICLGHYQVSDKVVWSSNPDCQHAFHQECILDWLIKMQPETPCPCCRQEFTDLEKVRASRKITWAGSDASAWGSVTF